MSEQNDTPPAGANPEDPQYQAHAAQAVSAVQQPDQATDAGQSIEEMMAQRVRVALSGFEQQLADQMKAAEAAFASQQSTIEALTRQLASVRAQAGPPVAELLASSLADRVQAIAKANPDLGAQHFTGVITQAASLADEVKAVAGGSGDASRVEQLANGIGAWFARVHPRLSGKVLEGAHAAMDEAERIIEALPELAPAAAAVAKAL